MSFFKKLFGLGRNNDSEDIIVADNAPDNAIEYQGFTIRATPYKSEGQFQSCGIISKEIYGEVKEHRFVRADRFSSMDNAVQMIHIKARQIIDEQGEELLK